MRSADGGADVRARHLERLAEDGYTIVEGAVPRDLVAALKQALARIEREHAIGHGPNDFEGRLTVRIYNLLAHDPMFEQVPVHPAVLPIAEALLDDGLLLSSLSAIMIDPGEQAQPIHADTQLIPLPRPHPPIAVNAMWALDDFTEANGTTRIVPGSHRFEQQPEYGGVYETVAAEMPAGSVLIWNSALWHGGGANLTSGRRAGIACYYCAGYLRQQENQLLGIPRARAAGFSRRLQELCGYGVYQGLYGHIEKSDPIELLGRARRGRMVWDAGGD